jgi:hypothetical protein
MTAFRPGASPPPVQMPIQRMSDIVAGYWIVVIVTRGAVTVVVLG